MKKPICVVLSALLLCAMTLGLAGCGRLPEAAEERISPVIGSDPSGAEGISPERAEEIAREQCKVNYDSIRTEFDDTGKEWSVEFWRGNEILPAQTVQIDTEGNITAIIYSE